MYQTILKEQNSHTDEKSWLSTVLYRKGKDKEFTYCIAIAVNNIEGLSETKSVTEYKTLEEAEKVFGDTVKVDETTTDVKYAAQPEDEKVIGYPFYRKINVVW